MIDVLAKEMKINYILDPRVTGKVTIYTYGEVKPVELMPLLETLLRVNGATIVKVGEFYRIVPINTISTLPLPPVMNADPKTLPDDERMILNLIFLKYTTAAEMDKLLSPFYGEGASHSVYEAGESPDPPGQCAEYEAHHGSAGALRFRHLRRAARAPVRYRAQPPQRSRQGTGIGFQGLRADRQERRNREVPPGRPHQHDHRRVSQSRASSTMSQKWIEKLDLPGEDYGGAVSNYVYRLKYGRAETVAMAIMALYSGNPIALDGTWRRWAAWAAGWAWADAAAAMGDGRYRRRLWRHGRWAATAVWAAWRLRRDGRWVRRRLSAAWAVGGYGGYPQSIRAV